MRYVRNVDQPYKAALAVTTAPAAAAHGRADSEPDDIVVELRQEREEPGV